MRLPGVTEKIVTKNRLSLIPTRAHPLVFFLLLGIGLHAHADNLTEVNDFGDNPGNLRMWIYQADSKSSKRPLVVALHGCKQTAHDYAAGSGWQKYAERFNFNLLLPEQKRGWWGNNKQGCFNWFYQGDQQPGRGESQSIRKMITTLIKRNIADPGRIYITGLSAGGAMTAVMLSNYPALFKGGAIIAGVPFACSQVPNYVPAWWLDQRWSWSYTSPLVCMKPGVDLSAQNWGDKVRSLHTATITIWPSVLISHSDADKVVSVRNAYELVEQWTSLHDVTSTPHPEQYKNYTRYEHKNNRGDTVVTLYLFHGLEHGQPIKPRGWFAKETLENCGKKGRYMLNSPLCASYRIALSWQLIPGVQH